jgi:uncharacterized protein
MSSAKKGGPVRPSTSVWRPLGVDEIRITGGLWGQKQRLNADAILQHCESWMERIGWIGNFDRAAADMITGSHAGIEFVDSEVYKLLEAMAWELGREPSDILARRYQVLVERVAAAQEQDGYLHTSFGRAGQPPRYSSLEAGHELYCFGHLLQAAVARLRTGHDDVLPQVARRLADHVDRQFGPDGRVGVCGHPEIEMALVELARATGERRYLELARLFVDRRGAGTLGPHPFGQEYFQDDMPVRQATTMRGHAVRALYLAAGALDVATETGDRELAGAVERQWANGVAHRTYITGGVGSHHQDEAFGDDFELPADRAYAETCAGIGSVMLSWRLLLSTGEDRYADLIERTLLNNVLASPRADGRAFYYTNTLHQRTPGQVPDEQELSHRAESGLRAPWFEVSCCPTNVARTLASVSLYFATASDDGLQLHQYGDYRVSTELAAGRLTVQVSSDYPAGDTVTVNVVEAPAAETTLRLRVPAWALGTAKVSEGPTAQTTSHVEVRRAFRAGDSVRVTFPAGARATHPDPRIDSARGAFAVEQGPLVLALESTDLPPGWSVNEVTADPHSLAADDTGATTIDVYRHDPVPSEWPYYAEPDEKEGERVRVRLIPYHQWANRGPATMRTWLPISARRSLPSADGGGGGAGAGRAALDGGEHSLQRPGQPAGVDRLGQQAGVAERLDPSLGRDRWLLAGRGRSRGRDRGLVRRRRQRLQDQLGDRLKRDRGGVDDQVVVPGIGRVGPVQAADVGVASPVGGLQVASGLVRSDCLDRGPLHDAEVGRPVEAHVEALVLAEHDRRPAAEDHARVLGRHPPDVFLAVPAQALVLVVGRDGRLGRAERHGLHQRGEQPVGRGQPRLFRSKPFKTGLGSAAASAAGRRPLQEGDAEPLRQRRRDHRAARAVRGRHGDQPGPIGTHRVSPRRCHPQSACR